MPFKAQCCPASGGQDVLNRATVLVSDVDGGRMWSSNMASLKLSVTSTPGMEEHYQIKWGHTMRPNLLNWYNLV